MMDPLEKFLSLADEQTLLRIARDALELWVREERRLDLDAYALSPVIEEKHGAFVTLHNGDALRGCVGYATNREPLAATVRDNAINAAHRDMRFDPITVDELPQIQIEISALMPGESPESPLVRVHDPREIVIGRDGLHIEFPYMRGGLLLPQVASREGWSVDQFLRAVCRKAGYPDDAWKDPEVRLYRFRAQVFGEDARGA